MDELKLPANFNKCSTIIKYYKNNDVDCLSTLSEWFRFYIIHVFSKAKKYINKLDGSFLKTLYDNTNLKNSKNFYWGRWSSPDIDSFYCYDIKKLTFLMPGFDISFKMNENFLYEELSKVSDNEINNYFNDLFLCGTLSPITQIYDTFIITNKFNKSKIIVQKDLFRKYCGYQKILDNYNNLIENVTKNKSLDSFSIDIFFEDKVADDISYLLNEKAVDVTNYTLDELEQKFNVFDFLQITINYDNIKL